MIAFSRHARARMKLYGIAAEDVAAVIEAPDATEQQEDAVAMLKEIPGKYGGLPLKVVARPSRGGMTVVTVYPLKKRAWRTP